MRFSILYLLSAILLLCTACSGGQETTAPATGDDAFLEDVQRRTFSWFWETTPEETGLVPDRWPTEAFSSIAAIGFGLTGYLVGVERGYVTREQARERVLTTLDFLWNAPQNDGPTEVTGYKGFFYHFLKYEDGYRYRTNELSTIDTALLMAGVLSAMAYFDGDHADEQRIRKLADDLYRRVEWDWYQVHSSLITMGWGPERGFGKAEYEGYNEAMLLYVLALGSPTHPIGPEAWEQYTSTYTWADFYGYEHLNFTPLFGHQYSHVWIDFRGIQDEYMREKGLDYFENSRRATLAQKAYAQDNPLGWKGYGGDFWGLTASDGPQDTTIVWNGEERRIHTYTARGASAEHVVDDGTLVPTAAGGSVPFAPEITIPALKAMRDRYGERLYDQYGFHDAFNPSFTWDNFRKGSVTPEGGWVDLDYLGIDQGPILLMIENHRTGFVWDLMRDNPYLVRGLCRAGFAGGWLVGKCNG